MRRAAAGRLAAAVALLVAGPACDDATSPPDDGVVRGTVTRLYTSDGVAGARVAIDGQVDETASDGSFQFPHVTQGERTLTVTAPDYRDHAEQILVTAWQSVDVVLTPLDTLVAVSGQVRHAIDGPQRVRVVLPDREVDTDAEGRWTADDVPLGPLRVRIDHPPYNAFDENVLVQRDGQVLDLVLTRDVLVSRPIEHDAYICTTDSTNANRGQSEVLWISETLGRIALFSMAPPSGEWGDAPIASATLRLHGYLRPEEGCFGENTVVLVTYGLADTFYENAVDASQRPAFRNPGQASVTLDVGPRDQSFDIDVTAIYDTSENVGGVALALMAGPCGVGVLSSEQGVAAWRPRLDVVVRY